MTGLAQANGRNALSWEEKFALDVAYVKTRTFGGDLRILARTLCQCIRPRGICHAGEATMSEFQGQKEEQGR